MGVAYSAERGLLAEDEVEPIERSHLPLLEAQPRAALLELARWLRARRARARDILYDRRRLRRGKGEPRGTAAEQASERGLAAKKQIYARALKRVNARIEALDDAARRAEALTRLRAALARVQGERAPHPGAGATARRGMRAAENRKHRPTIHPARIGSTSQAGKAAQARRDARG
jgi:hypothetical protein